MLRPEEDGVFYDDRAGSGSGIPALQPLWRMKNMWNILLVTGWLIMDVRTRRVPVWMLALGGVLAAWAVFCQYGGYPEVLKGCLPGLLLVAVAFATKKAGYGDGIVLCCLGVVLGGERSLLLFGISLFLISLCALILLALRRVKRNTGLPFLPFLAVAWILVVNL